MRSRPIMIHALAAFTAAGALVVGAGCQALDDAGQVIDPADLVNDLAARLDRSVELTYSADYRLPGGQGATIAQDQNPLRTAYSYPGGKLTVSTAATTECRTHGATTTCTLTPPPSPTAKPAAAIFAAANHSGLVAPPVVIGLLTAAALDVDAVIEQNDTTIAGRHATCVQVDRVKNAAAAKFDACITNEGVLGSFVGMVNGTNVDIAMSRYRDSVDADAFDLPPRTKIIDRRPGAR